MILFFLREGFFRGFFVCFTYKPSRRCCFSPSFRCRKKIPMVFPLHFPEGATFKCFNCYLLLESHGFTNITWANTGTAIRHRPKAPLLYVNVLLKYIYSVYIIHIHNALSVQFDLCEYVRYIDTTVFICIRVPRYRIRRRIKFGPHILALLH